jgi:glycosyltransferase involved in cell wall biosynthesis
MRITIITPSFNQAQFLEQTIDSVLSQKGVDLEYMIFDGGSTDGSVEIIKKHEHHLAYWQSERDNGQSHAINKGLSRAKGEIVNWLNSDDYYEPDALATIGEAFESETVNVVCARSKVILNDQVLYETSGTDVFHDNLPKTIGWARTDQPETFFRRSAFKSVGPLNESLKYVMDKEWWIRYLLTLGSKGIIKLDKCIVNFRHHAASKSISQAEGFEKETLGIFHAIAMHSGNNDYAQFLYSQLKNEIEGIAFSFPPIDRAFGRQIIDYFMLRKADEFYYQLQFGKAKSLLASINKESLNATDQRLHEKLLFRSRFPEWLIKFIR